MKPNYVLFIILSFLILFGWNYAVVKRQPPPAPSSVVTPDTSAGTPSPSPSTIEERRVEKTIGRHRVEFNAVGAGVLQWWIEDDLRVPLVLPDADGENPLAAFRALSFTDVSTGNDVAFEAVRPDGLKVRQSYRIDPAGFLHAAVIHLENTGKAPVDASFGLGWGPGIESGDGAPADRRAEQSALILNGEQRFSTLNWIFSKLTLGVHSGNFRWFAVDSHYFVAAFLNDGGGPVNVDVEKKEKFFSARRMEHLTLNPGENKEIVQRFYLGPKIYDGLAAYGLGLERTVNFGLFTTLGRWIHWALLAMKGFTGNFGWAIIALTFIVQVLLSPLTVHSFKHSQKMKTIQPQMKRLQEMYKSDPKRLNSEMLALYQRHGLRFMGMEGCLPVLIQMPVFFALYAVLSKTYELRHAPWIGWVTDLSLKDPFYVMPVLMGGAMFFQQKMTLNNADPSQKQLMYLMPVMFTFIFLKMPSGLVIYWLTQSLLTLALQLFLLKRSKAQKAVVL